MTVWEGIVCNRPLTAAASDPYNLETRHRGPNHLLMLRPTALPGPIDDDNEPRHTWKQVRYLAEPFWKRWTSEYLPLLRSRTKWQASQEESGSRGYGHENGPPSSPRPVEALPGDDRRARVVKLLKPGRELTSPVSKKLCLLEARATSVRTSSSPAGWNFSKPSTTTGHQHRRGDPPGMCAVYGSLIL